MDEGNESGTPPPGWYRHPTMADTQRYWDGHQWTSNIAPMPTAPARAGHRNSTAAMALILAASAVGVVMSMQSASLLTGTGTLWTGAAIAIAAGVASWVMRRSIPTGVRVVVVLAALLAFANATYVENQLDEKRQEIGDILRYDTY